MEYSRDYDAVNALAYLLVPDNRIKKIREATEQDAKQCVRWKW